MKQQVLDCIVRYRQIVWFVVAMLIGETICLSLGFAGRKHAGPEYSMWFFAIWGLPVSAVIWFLGYKGAMKRIESWRQGGAKCPGPPGTES